MKASKLIELLAKRIAERGDKEVYFCTTMTAGLPDSEHDVDFEIKSISTDGHGNFGIYGEMV